MACDITAGRARACRNNLGGTSKIFLFNYVENPFTVVAGEATAINPLLTQIYEYEIEGDLSKLDGAMPTDINTGTTVNTQTLTISIPKMDAATNNQLNLLAYGRPQAVIKDRNGLYHVVGYDDGIAFTVTPTTGGAKGEMNGYTLTGVTTSGSLFPILNSATATAFIALL